MAFLEDGFKVVGLAWWRMLQIWFTAHANSGFLMR
jgi:hypothetical protein